MGKSIKQQKTILLIEDDNVIGKNLESFLSDAGFRVELVTQGDVGLKKALAANYDLLLLDIWLPKVNGFEILQALADQGLRVLVLILSNSGQPVEIDKALKLGVKDYLVKANFTPEEVLQKIKKLLA